MDTATSVLETPSGEARHPVTYDGSSGAIGWLALKNVLLTLVTLGIYRFWAKTRMRRYLWSHVSVFGDRFEYTGTGGELFRGFLIVLVFLFVLGTAYGIAGMIFIEPGTTDEVVGTALYLAVFAFLYHYAVWRTYRYRISRTQWRGVRGALIGSSWRYARTAFGLSLLRWATLWLLHPWVAVRLQRMLTAHSWFGDRRCSFEGSPWPLYGAWLLVYSPGIAVLGCLGYLGYDEYAGDGLLLEALSRWDVMAFLIPAAIVVIAAILLLYARYRALELRYFASVTRLESLRLESTVRGRHLVGIYLAYLLLTGGAILLILFAIWNQFMSGRPEVADGLVLLIVVVLIGLPFLSVFRFMIVVHGLARRVLGSLTIVGDIDVEAIVQSAEAKPARGEGLAEMLDVGAI